MPTQASIPAPANMPVISNALEDMVAGGIGPDQARCRVETCEYVEFDYAGQMRDDPVIAVKMNLTPLDGENEGKNFDVEWATGAKAKDFSIVNNGGALSPVVPKSTLAPNSNWGYFLQAFVDASQFKTALLNGPSGIGYFTSTEMVIRRVPQPTRSGLDAKTASGRDKTFYTCLKVDVLPGEKKPAATTRRAAPAPAAAPRPAQAQTPAVNGAAAASYLDLIAAALASNGGSLTVVDLPKQVFQAGKAAGSPAKANHEAGQAALALVQDEARFYEVIGEHGLNWSLSEGVLAG
jgi:pyruvate/2-oxoglutarate dehydrogenase complex dihydrolipoamide acyltransferase (E2) component